MYSPSLLNCALTSSLVIGTNGVSASTNEIIYNDASNDSDDCSIFPIDIVFLSPMTKDMQEQVKAQIGNIFMSCEKQGPIYILNRTTVYEGDTNMCYKLVPGDNEKASHTGTYDTKKKNCS